MSTFREYMGIVMSDLYVLWDLVLYGYGAGTTSKIALMTALTLGGITQLGILLKGQSCLVYISHSMHYQNPTLPAVELMCYSSRIGHGS